MTDIEKSIILHDEALRLVNAQRTLHDLSPTQVIGHPPYIDLGDWTLTVSDDRYEFTHDRTGARLVSAENCYTTSARLFVAHLAASIFYSDQINQLRK